MCVRGHTDLPCTHDRGPHGRWRKSGAPSLEHASSSGCQSTGVQALPQVTSWSITQGLDTKSGASTGLARDAPCCSGGGRRGVAVVVISVTCARHQHMFTAQAWTACSGYPDRALQGISSERDTSNSAAVDSSKPARLGQQAHLARTPVVAETQPRCPGSLGSCTPPRDPQQRPTSRAETDAMPITAGVSGVEPGPARATDRQSLSTPGRDLTSRSCYQTGSGVSSWSPDPEGRPWLRTVHLVTPRWQAVPSRHPGFLLLGQACFAVCCGPPACTDL